MSWKHVSLMSAKCHNIESLCTVRTADSRWKTQSPFCQGKLRLGLTVGLHAGTHSPNPLLLEPSPSPPALRWGRAPGGHTAVQWSWGASLPRPGAPAGLCGPFVPLVLSQRRCPSSWRGGDSKAEEVGLRGASWWHAFSHCHTGPLSLCPTSPSPTSVRWMSQPGRPQHRSSWGPGLGLLEMIWNLPPMFTAPPGAG